MGSYMKKSDKIMRVMNLTEDSKIYTSNVFFVLGEWNTLDDINTLIDVGSDSMVIDKLLKINTGLGKRKVDQVIITHSHSDHTAILPQIIEAFHPKVYAFNAHVKGVDHVLHDGDILRIGELYFEVIHITTHSYDSICLFSKETGILFAGDTYFPIEFENMALKEENAYAVSRLDGRLVKKVYFGHGSAQSYDNKLFRVIK
jgi:glyoxylase-like metal-dependent hydrolase (beta-lactamase superfamily II)